MATPHDEPGSAVHPGDIIEASGLPGRPPRRGEVVEVLGAPGHEHYRVRWDQEHESVFFPTEGVRVVRAQHGQDT